MLIGTASERSRIVKCRGRRRPGHSVCRKRVENAAIRAWLSLVLPGGRETSRQSTSVTAHILISGTLYRAPEQRTSKSGKPFVTGTLRVKDGDAFIRAKLDSLKLVEETCETVEPGNTCLTS
jgi:hypothetical protein